MKNSNSFRLIVFVILMLSGISTLFSQTVCNPTKPAATPPAGVVVRTVPLPDLVPTPDAPDPIEPDLNATGTETKSQSTI